MGRGRTGRMSRVDRSALEHPLELSSFFSWLLIILLGGIGLLFAYIYFTSKRQEPESKLRALLRQPRQWLLLRKFRGEVLDAERRDIRDNDNIFSLQRLGASASDIVTQEKALQGMLALVLGAEQKMPQVLEADMRKWLRWMHHSAMPNVSQRIPILVAGLAWSQPNNGRLIRVGGCRDLVASSRSASLRKQLNAAVALAVATRDDVGRDSVVEHDGIGVFTALARSPDARLRQVAAVGLAQICRRSSQKALLAKHETTTSLLTLARSDDPVAQTAATFVLSELLWDVAVRSRINIKTMRTLTANLLARSAPLRCITAYALKNLMSQEHDRIQQLSESCEWVSWHSPERIQDLRALEAIKDTTQVIQQLKRLIDADALSDDDVLHLWTLATVCDPSSQPSQPDSSDPNHRKRVRFASSPQLLRTPSPHASDEPSPHATAEIADASSGVALADAVVETESMLTDGAVSAASDSVATRPSVSAMDYCSTRPSVSALSRGNRRVTVDRLVMKPTVSVETVFSWAEQAIEQMRSSEAALNMIDECFVIFDVQLLMMLVDRSVDELHHLLDALTKQYAMLERQGSANIKEGDSVQVCRPIEVQAKVIAQLIVEAKRAARHINADAKKLGKQQAAVPTGNGSRSPSVWTRLAQTRLWIRLVDGGVYIVWRRCTVAVKAMAGLIDRSSANDQVDGRDDPTESREHGSLNNEPQPG